MTKKYVRYDMVYARMRGIEKAMQAGYWHLVADLANELSMVWGTVADGARQRMDGPDAKEWTGE
jgi:hypothetical protein